MRSIQEAQRLAEELQTFWWERGYGRAHFWPIEILPEIKEGRRLRQMGLWGVRGNFKPNGLPPR